MHVDIRTAGIVCDKVDMQLIKFDRELLIKMVGMQLIKFDRGLLIKKRLICD